MGDVAKIENGKRRSLIDKFGSQYHIEPEKVLPILKNTAFQTRSGEPTNEQMAALLIVADQYQLNPFTKEIYAFEDKQKGIVPVVGVDGWARIINSHDNLDGMEFEYAVDVVESDEHKPCPAWVMCKIYRKGRANPVAVTEYFDECYRAPFKDGKKGPWQTHTKRMLRHKAMIQCARIAFGFTGIYEPDEAERIRDAEYIDITPSESVDELNAELGLTADEPDEAENEQVPA